MSLAAYTSTSVEDKIDTDHPFAITFDGRTGGIQEKCFYIRNDNLDSWYNNISVSLVDTTFIWKLLDKDRVPIPEDWETVVPGNTIVLSDSIGSASLGDISTFLPVWVRIEVPEGTPIQMIDDIIIRLSFTRNLV